MKPMIKKFALITTVVIVAVFGMWIWYHSLGPTILGLDCWPNCVSQPRLNIELKFVTGVIGASGLFIAGVLSKGN